MIPYSIHVALLLAICLLFYKLLLQKETYYRLNRVMLLTCLVLAFTLPLVPVPQQFSLREAAPINTTVYAPAVSQPITPVIQDQSPAKTSNAVKQITAQPESAKITEEISFTHRIIKWAFWLYWCGVAVFGFNFLLQIVVLLYQAYKKPFMQDGIYRIVELDDDKAPCSFGNNIFINPAKYDWETYNQILIHEKIHIKQGHSLDLIVAELMLVMQWFNPFAWLYRKELESNLEFLTDASVLNRLDVEPADYQLSLLKVSVPNYSLRITTNYNQSLLKKRILMMGAKKSNIHIIWKYFMLVPLLVILVCGLNKPVAVSSVLPKQHTVITDYHVNNNKQFLNDSARVNNKRHVVAKNLLKSPVSQTNAVSVQYVMVDSAPGVHNQLKTITKPIVRNNQSAAITIGSVAKSNETKSLKRVSNDSIYNFNSREIPIEYARGFVNIGYRNISVNDLAWLHSEKITPEYVKGFIDIGSKNIPVSDIIALHLRGIPADYVKSFFDIDYKNVNLSDIIALYSRGITAAYVKNFIDINFKSIRVSDLLVLYTRGISYKYIKGFMDIDYKNVSINDITTLYSKGITPAYIKGFMDIDYKSISVNDILTLYSKGITPTYIKGFMDIDYKNLTVNDITALYSRGITAKYVKGFMDIDYRSISANDIINLYSHGISHEYIKSLLDINYRSTTVSDIIALYTRGISYKYIKGFMDIDYKNVTPPDILTLYRFGINQEYVKGFMDIGYKNLTVNDIVALHSRGITAEYVKGFIDSGYKKLTVMDILNLNSHGTTPK